MRCISLITILLAFAIGVIFGKIIAYKLDKPIYESERLAAPIHPTAEQIQYARDVLYNAFGATVVETSNEALAKTARVITETKDTELSFSGVKDSVFKVFKIISE